MKKNVKKMVTIRVENLVKSEREVCQKNRRKDEISLLFTIKIAGRYFGRGKKSFKIKKKFEF